MTTDADKVAFNLGISTTEAAEQIEQGAQRIRDALGVKGGGAAEVPAELVERAAEILADARGGEGWWAELGTMNGRGRANYRKQAAAVAPLLFQAGRDNERQKIAAEIEPHIETWLRRPEHPPVIGDVVWQLRQILQGISDGE